MSSNDTTATRGTLALTGDQDTFTPNQRAVLAHMGVQNAPEEDLQVFAYVAQRTGLDPFARQIHMIGRSAKLKDANGREYWGMKYTIQTGIDGYRLIGRRAADAAKVAISVGAPEWAHEDGSWRPVWSNKWGRPVGARVTIRRGDSPFTGVALFEEYAQTKKDGGLTQMWSQRPAGQLAKCAEAMAWRMAFPQDMYGVYVDDEMHQADNAAELKEPTREKGAVSAGAFAPAAKDEPTATADELSDDQKSTLTALFENVGIPRNRQAEYIVDTIGQRDMGRKLTVDEADRVIGALRRYIEGDGQTVDAEVVEEDPPAGGANLWDQEDAEAKP